ncbi:DUF4314 domain-containing protein [uncultured Granulicatella sp.]|uniref:DUF4314 domain-containing protein n=1 Tax=uncultured Granulicatella sp. TaxID=316089 RepID=UPI0037DD8B07
MKFLSREIVEEIRKRYPKGSRVALVFMDDTQAPPVGTLGTILGVDDIGSLMVEWDNGSHLNVIYGEDKVRIVHYNKTIQFQFEEVRTTGLVNMLDYTGVQRIAMILGYSELVEFIKNYRKEYFDLLGK